MDELIGRLVDTAGIDKATAEKVVAIILDFLNKEGPAETVKPLIDALPGAAASPGMALTTAPTASSPAFSRAWAMNARVTLSI
jgi:hypothetical protein